MSSEEFYEELQAQLDALQCELHARRTEERAGIGRDLPRRLLLEGLEIGLKLVMQQLETLAVYDLDGQGIDLSDPSLYADLPTAPDDERSDPAHLGGI